ncbi:MAG: hypothetical protein NTX15_04205 [Candidatus Kapabacteria bacterium]|nr:hypothetical protein [Candidatus Kapabacteria bacterium]
MATQSLEPHELRLRFVPAEEVALHEETDTARVQRIRAALDNDGVLRNPPIIGRLDHVNSNVLPYTVLDGATRTTALKLMGARDILVQEVPYGGSDGVELQAWYHVLPVTAAKKVIEAVEAGSHPASIVERTTLARASEALRMFQAGVQGRACAAIVRGEDDVLLLHPSGPDISTPRVLRELVALYGGSGEIYRIVHDDLISTVRGAAECPAIVMFPSFSPENIVYSAKEADLLPAGITRHIIPGRVLNLNISLHLLMASTPIEEKNAWLHDVVTSKILARKVRYYHEPVFVFDD